MKNLKAALKDLPTGLQQLEKAYDQTLARINSNDPDDVSLAKRVFYWIVNARRPLSAAELQAALAVKIGDSEPDEKNVVRIDETIALCAGLVTVDNETNAIRLIHFTTDEFFKHNGARWIADTSECIASTCLTYLSFQEFLSGPCKSAPEFETRHTRHPFLSYAATHWGHHSYDSQDKVQKLAVEFLSNVDLVHAACQSYRQWTWRVSELQTEFNILGIHLAAKVGLHILCLDLVDTGLHADSRDDDGRTPLSLAAQWGHEMVVTLLQGHEDVAADSRDNNGKTPLSWAAEWGREEVVMLLLERGDVAADSRDNSGRTPLSHASKAGKERVVKLLLKRRDVAADSRDNHGKTPLSWAAEWGGEKVVRLLLERGDVAADSRDNNGLTSLSLAAKMGREKVVRPLLEREDVAADSRDNMGQTPFSWAAQRGHEGVMQLLLERGDVAADSRDNNGRTPLSRAAKWGRKKAVMLLLERGDVAADSRDEDGTTPLSYAAGNGHEELTKLLLEQEEVDADSKNNYGTTPLFSAAQRGHQDVVEIILDAKDNGVNSKDVNGRTLLWWLAAYADAAFVQRFVGRAGVRTITAADDFGQTPLLRAAEYGNEAVVELLLDYGGGHSTNFKDEDGRTPLLLAAKNGHAAAVKLLLSQRDIDLSAEDTSGRTAYSWSVEEGHTEVKILLDEAMSNLEGKHAGFEQPPHPELTPPLAKADEDVEQAMEAEPSAPIPLVSNAQPDLMHPAHKPDRTPEPPKTRLTKRPARERPGCRAGVAATLRVDADRTVRICATTGERGSSASVFTRPQADRRNAQGPERDLNILAFSAADSASPSARLSLTVRMTASAPQITVLTS